MNRNNSFAGAHGYRGSLEDYLMALIERRDITKERVPAVTTFQNSKSYGVQLAKYKPTEFKGLGKHHPEQYFEFPDWSNKKTWGVFKQQTDSVQSKDPKRDLRWL